MVAGADVHVDGEPTEGRSRDLVLGRAPVIGDVAGHSDEVDVVVVAQVIEYVVERERRVVRAGALRLEARLAEVRIGQLHGADRTVHGEEPNQRTTWASGVERRTTAG